MTAQPLAPSTDTPRDVRLRTVAGALFALSWILPGLNDLRNGLVYLDQIATHLVRWFEPSMPHVAYHVYVPTVGFFLVGSVLTGAVVAGPYRRGEQWAAWALPFATACFIGSKAVGSAALVPHWVEQVALPAGLWLIALAASVAAGGRWRKSIASSRLLHQ